MARLFAPVKDQNSLLDVFNAGAKSAYAGIWGFCRHQADAVRIESLGPLAETAHHLGGSLIAAINLVPMADREQEIYDIIDRSLQQGADGVILNDAGIIRKARRMFPKAHIMASAGISAINRADTAFLAEAGADTVLVSEFLSSFELTQIKQKTKAGIEIFGLGIREFGYTGRCIISSYFCQKSHEGRICGSPKRGGICFKQCLSPFSADDGKKGPLPTEQLCLADNLDEYLDLADVIKLSRGSLEWREFLDIIRLMAEKIASGKKTHG